MNLLKRFAFYFGGFAIGLIILFFIWDKKNSTFDYGPNSRTLKNIRLKERVFTEKSLNVLQQHQLDTSAISHILIKGDVLFKESNTKLDSCKIYLIEGDVLIKEGSNSHKKLKITVENCSEKATVQNVLVVE